MMTAQLQLELQPIKQELTIIQADLSKKHTQVTETILQMQAQLTALLTLLPHLPPQIWRLVEIKCPTGPPHTLNRHSIGQQQLSHKK